MQKESHLNHSLVLQILDESRINTPTYKDGKTGVWEDGGKVRGWGWRSWALSCKGGTLPPTPQIYRGY